MKRAMWSVDPSAGVKYIAARKKDGQEVLFTSDPKTADTAPLLDHLREQFGTDWFSIEEAEKTTLLDTSFLHDGHLKNRTLLPARKAELIEVGDSDRRGDHQFFYPWFKGRELQNGTRRNFPFRQRSLRCWKLRWKA